MFATSIWHSNNRERKYNFVIIAQFQTEYVCDIKQNVLENFLTFCKLPFLICRTHLGSYLKENKLVIKDAGLDPIGMVIV